MLYLGACTGDAPPICQPCEPVGDCDFCTEWMLAPHPYYDDPEYILEYDASTTIQCVSYSGQVTNATREADCGTFPQLALVVRYDGLSLSVEIPTAFSEIVICGIRPYNYAVDWSTVLLDDCDSLTDFSDISVSLSGQVISITADQITLYNTSYQAEGLPENLSDAITVVLRVTYGGERRYASIHLAWNGDGSEITVAPYVNLFIGECVPYEPPPPEPPEGWPEGWSWPLDMSGDAPPDWPFDWPLDTGGDPPEGWDEAWPWPPETV